MGAIRGSFSTLRRFPVVYGVVLALIWALIGAGVVAVWAQIHALTDNQLTAYAYVVHCVSVLFGALGASRAANERGWYYGGMAGLFYALVMVVLSLIVYNTFSFDATGLFRVLLMTLIGAFGGILGVALKGD